MKNFLILLKPSWVVKITLFLSLVGLLDASFLTFKHFVGGPLPCSILAGCEAVTTSSYAVIFGVPVALLGAIFYLTLAILAVWHIDTNHKLALRSILILSVFGFAFSLYLIYLQVFVIGALCLYCLVSAGATTIIFLLNLSGYFTSRLYGPDLSFPK